LFDSSDKPLDWFFGVGPFVSVVLFDAPADPSGEQEPGAIVNDPVEPE